MNGPDGLRQERPSGVVQPRGAAGRRENEAKALLATEATSLCHGRDEAEAAAETARRTFGRAVDVKVSADLGALDTRVEVTVVDPHTSEIGQTDGLQTPIGVVTVDLPTIEVPQARLDAYVPVYELLCKARFTKSNSEARRLIRGGSARVNDERVTDETGTVGSSDLTAEGTIKLSAGRKRHALVRPV